MRAFIVVCGLCLIGSAFADEPPKWSQMQTAVLRDHDQKKVRALVAGGLDPNAPIGCGTYAPLNGAIQENDSDLVALLLSLGAKPTDTQMVQAVGASTPNALKMVKMLLAAGGSINARDYYAQTKDRFTNPIHRAVSHAEREMITFLLSQPGIELNNPDVDDRTPLMIAITKGDAEVVDMLLAAGADPRQKNRAGLDAAAVANGVIDQQRGILGKLAHTPEALRSQTALVEAAR